MISASSCARSPAGRLIETLAAFRPGPITTPTAATKMALRALARRHQHLSEESPR